MIYYSYLHKGTDPEIYQGGCMADLGVKLDLSYSYHEHYHIAAEFKVGV